VPHFHAVVWIDHREARIFHFNREQAEERVLRADRPDVQVHHKAGAIGSGKAEDDRSFLDAVAQALADAGEVLIVGPSGAKLDLVRCIERRHRELRDKLVGVESLDHPTDAQLVAYARSYFAAVDRMRPQLRSQA
jgi:hypothetical protein